MSDSRPDPAYAVSRIAEVLARHLPDGLPTVAVAMANNPDVIGAIARAVKRRLARFILIGPADEIHELARSDGAALADAQIVEEKDAARACDRAAAMAASGEAQVVMKGLVQTADFVRSILNREHGLVPEGGLLSHVALCDVDGFDRLLFVSDAAIMTYPDELQKRRIVENAVRCARALGVERPRVAMIAPVEKVSEKIPSTVAAAAVRDHFAGQSHCVVDGPFGLDVAISEEAATVKAVGGTVAGRADILIVPSIDAGNVLYKALTGFVKARVAGTVAGASVPIVLTSRADSEEAKLLSLEFALAVSAAG